MLELGLRYRAAVASSWNLKLAFAKAARTWGGRPYRSDNHSLVTEGLTKLGGIKSFDYNTTNMAGLVAYESSDDDSDLEKQVQEVKVCSIDGLGVHCERPLTW